MPGVFAALLRVHLVLAACSAVAFWLAACAPKGGRFHRAVGRRFSFLIYATAVTGGVIVTVNPDMPNMPSIQQIGFTRQFYSTPVDGPIGISAFSKDLAFELYTTPEPSTWALLSLGAVGALVLRRRRPRD